MVSDDLQTLINRTTIDGTALVDTRRDWPKVQRVLNHHTVVSALDQGMNFFCTLYRRKWDRELGPWYYSVRPWRWVPGLVERTVHWRKINGMPETGDSPEYLEWLDANRPAAPERNSILWFQVFGGCYATVQFFVAVAGRIWRDYIWRGYALPLDEEANSFHCLAMGWPRRGGKTLVFDPLFEPRASEWIYPLGLTLTKCLQKGVGPKPFKPIGEFVPSDLKKWLGKPASE